jgi:hypothetical protein
VARLAGEINGESREDRIHCLDLAEAPTPVHAVAAGGQLEQRLDMPTFDFSRHRHLLEFFSHKNRFILASRPQNDIIKRGERTKTKRNCGARLAAAAGG